MTFSTTSTVPIEFMPNLGKRTAKVLKSLGIATIGQFKQLPEPMLIELFGPSIREPYQVVQRRVETPRTSVSSVEPRDVFTKPRIVEPQSKSVWQRLQFATQLFMML